MTIDFWSVPKIWPGETVAILGSGPSLTRSQVERLVGRCRIIAVNRSYVLAPEADWLFAGDVSKFWQWCSGPRRINRGEPDALDHAGTRITAYTRLAARKPEVGRMAEALASAGVKVLRHRGSTHREGMDDDPGWLRGSNGVHIAMGMAAHSGAARILLLGVDMRPGHFHPAWPAPQVHYRAAIQLFRSLVEPLHRRGIEVVNCTEGSALTWWPFASVEGVL